MAKKANKKASFLRTILRLFHVSTKQNCLRVWEKMSAETSFLDGSFGVAEGAKKCDKVLFCAILGVVGHTMTFVNTAKKKV